MKNVPEYILAGVAGSILLIGGTMAIYTDVTTRTNDTAPPPSAPPSAIDFKLAALQLMKNGTETTTGEQVSIDGNDYYVVVDTVQQQCRTAFYGPVRDYKVNLKTPVFDQPMC